MKPILLLVAGSALTGFCIPACRPSPKTADGQPAESPAPAIAIAPRDLPAGKLGYRLGTYLTIEGSRWAPDLSVKVDTVRALLVDTVNGKKLDSPLTVQLDNLQDPELPLGQRCVLRGYETGRMVGVPREVARAENLRPAQVGWHFARSFVLTSVVSPDSVKAKPLP